MTNAQLMYLLELRFGDCRFTSITFSEQGNMTVRFFDRGGNYHVTEITHLNRQITYDV